MAYAQANPAITPQPKLTPREMLEKMAVYRPRPEQGLEQRSPGGTAPDPCNTPAARGGRDATTHKSIRRLRHRTDKTRPGHLGATKFIVTVVGPVGFEPTTSGLDFSRSPAPQAHRPGKWTLVSSGRGYVPLTKLDDGPTRKCVGKNLS